MSYRIILESASPIVVVSNIAPPPPSEVPPTPPIIFPPGDTSPFIWPPQPLRRDDAAARYAGLGNGFYAGQGFQNPAPASNWWAGFIVQGEAGSWDLAGYDLWAPRDAEPAVIRRLLRWGR